METKGSKESLADQMLVLNEVLLQQRIKGALPFLGAESMEFGGFRAAKDFLWLTAGKSARWSGRREELVAKDVHGQHHYRH